MIDGEFVHRDSTGGGGVIANGDTQWMTAGAGIVHSEMPPERLIRSGGVLPPAPPWGELPAGPEGGAPRGRNPAGKRAALRPPAGGRPLVRAAAGGPRGVAGPGVTQTPITYLH